MSFYLLTQEEVSKPPNSITYKPVGHGRGGAAANSRLYAGFHSILRDDEADLCIVFPLSKRRIMEGSMYEIVDMPFFLSYVCVVKHLPSLPSRPWK